ncbi:hypothetical protein CTAYLR_003222 [Chrysophaeum taylorii]|uniref:Uncharacterized protein n=1 Tax=Chrysophaeum taylorii TaxID=2483200 RepID=A0AAD7UBC1_9STRA|nr:hypothetical protein CTAYLR_003222 [Chrysophaeum taylorii]
MITITDGVDFDTVAREWRLKWSDKDCLAAVHKLASQYFDAIKATKGFKGPLNRVVCGGCLDYKLIMPFTAEAFGDFEASGFGPEQEFLAKVKEIPGVSSVETQTFTFMPM